VNELEWLASGDPEAMLLVLSERRQTSDRKVRLFGCVCIRRIWGDLADEQLRQAAEVAERYADGGATPGQLDGARKTSAALCAGIGDIIADHGPLAIEAICTKAASLFKPSESALAVAAEARSDEGTDWNAVYEEEQRSQSDAIRDIFGNPFRPVTVSPIVLAWNDGVVVRLAQAAYEERQLPSGELDPFRLAVLADALEEAGATGELGEHLRSLGPHARGCWALDLVLGLT
jgi:hypothetical protein